MSDPFVGRVIPVAFDFAPVDWHLCDGSLLQISDYPALSTLLGTAFGGDGQTTFGLPDLRGRAVVGAGQGPGQQTYVLGQKTGTEDVTLTAAQFAAHTHGLAAATTATSPTPGASVVLGTPESTVWPYATAGTTTGLSPNAIGQSPGDGGPHENRQPYTTINYIIALFGVYPSPP